MASTLPVGRGEPRPLPTPIGHGSGWPAGAGTATGAPKVLGGLVQLRTCTAVTWVTGPPEVTVVIRICSTPGNVPVRVVTVQPVFWWLSRSSRIWKVEVVATADAVDVRPTAASRARKTVLARVDFKRFIGELLGRNVPRTLHPREGRAGRTRATRSAMADGIGDVSAANFGHQPPVIPGRAAC